MARTKGVESEWLVCRLIDLSKLDVRTKLILYVSINSGSSQSSELIEPGRLGMNFDAKTFDELIVIENDNRQLEEKREGTESNGYGILKLIFSSEDVFRGLLSKRLDGWEEYTKGTVVFQGSIRNKMKLTRLRDQNLADAMRTMVTNHLLQSSSVNGSGLTAGQMRLEQKLKIKLAKLRSSGRTSTQITLLSGHLYKQSEWRGVWNKRFFKLIYSTKTHRSSLIYNDTVLHLASSQAILSVAVKKKDSYGFQICSSGKSASSRRVLMTLCSESEEMCLEWIQHLNYVTTKRGRDDHLAKEKHYQQSLLSTSRNQNLQNVGNRMQRMSSSRSVQSTMKSLQSFSTFDSALLKTDFQFDQTTTSLNFNDEDSLHRMETTGLSNGHANQMRVEPSFSRSATEQGTVGAVHQSHKGDRKYLNDFLAFSTLENDWMFLVRYYNYRLLLLLWICNALQKQLRRLVQYCFALVSLRARSLGKRVWDAISKRAFWSVKSQTMKGLLSKLLLALGKVFDEVVVPNLGMLAVVAYVARLVYSPAFVLLRRKLRVFSLAFTVLRKLKLTEMKINYYNLPVEQRQSIRRILFRQLAEKMYAEVLDLGNIFFLKHRIDLRFLLGGIWIKSLQFIGSRPDVLPDTVVEVFSRLQDKVPPSSLEDITRVLEKELKQICPGTFAKRSEFFPIKFSCCRFHRGKHF